jgi:hypothetical protein
MKAQVPVRIVFLAALAVASISRLLLSLRGAAADRGGAR